MSLRKLSDIQRIVTDLFGNAPGSIIMNDDDVASLLSFISGSQTTYAPVSCADFVPVGATHAIINFNHGISGGATNITLWAKHPDATETDAHIAAVAAASTSREGVGRLMLVALDDNREFEARYSSSFTPLAASPAMLRGYVLGVNRGFRGSLAAVTLANQVLVSGANIVEFDAEPEDAEFWINVGGANPGRFTVQTNATRVELAANLELDLASTEVSAYITRNGVAEVGLPRQSVQDGPGTRFLNLSSGPVAVVPGDYFELVVVSDTNGDEVVFGDSSWMTTRIIK